MNLFDFHAHMAPTDAAAKSLLAQMQTNNIQKSIVVGGGLIAPEILSRWIIHGAHTATARQLHFNNKRLLTVCKSYRDQLLPFYFANPWCSTQEYRTLRTEFFGLKLAPALHGNNISVSALKEWLDLALAFNHPVYLHCTHHRGQQVTDLVRLAETFPQLNFILGHAGVGNLDLYAVTLIKPLQNIFFETSGGFSRVIEYASQELTSARVLFGSEYPLQNPQVEILKIKTLNICHSDKQMICSKNAQALIFPSKDKVTVPTTKDNPNHKTVEVKTYPKIGPLTEVTTHANPLLNASSQSQSHYNLNLDSNFKSNFISNSNSNFNSESESESPPTSTSTSTSTSNSNSNSNSSSRSKSKSKSKSNCKSNCKSSSIHSSNYISEIPQKFGGHS